MRILLIDNYDSFTYNLYQLLAQVGKSLPRVEFNDEISWEEIVDYQPDLIVLSPGPGRPERAEDIGICATILQRWEGPIFGVCLGLQAMVESEGGKIIHAPEPMHGRLSSVFHRGDEMFAAIASGAKVVRYHSLMAGPELPETLIPTAWTEDGLLMAAKHQTKAWWGVQYHPESVGTASGEQLIRNVLRWVGEEISSGTLSPKKSLNSPNVQLKQTWVHHWDAIEWSRGGAALFEQLFGQHEAAFWLDSSAAGIDSGGWSFMGGYGEGPLDQLLTYSQPTNTWSVKGPQEIDHPGDWLTYLRTQQSQQQVRSTDLPFPFVGGWVGWMGYEARAWFDLPVHHTGETPDVALWFCTRFLALDHANETCYLVALSPEDEPQSAQAWLQQMKARLHSESFPSTAPDPGQLLRPIQLKHSESAYLEQIQQAQAFIRDGESYEICLTNEWETSWQGDPLTLYQHLRKINPAPYAAFFRLGGHSILSSSPERFLQIDPSGQVSSKPIKGTLERSDDPLIDASLRNQLANSEKDQAENLMIVDLLRNDLGKVSEIGSVQVPKLMAIESFASVHQMVSTVQAQLKAGLTPWEVLEAAFPGGSITGAPKRRTLDLIEQLEQRPRGVYTGSIGYVGLDGRSDWNIAIRTISLEREQLRFGSGGAITHLSDPKAEFREILIKSLPLLRAIQAASGKAQEDWSFLSGIEASDWPDLFYPHPVGVA